MVILKKKYQVVLQRVNRMKRISSDKPSIIDRLYSDRLLKYMDCS
jgi:hypothetical protein